MNTIKGLERTFLNQEKNSTPPITPTATATATVPATNTPETKKDVPVPCGILSDCSQAEVIDWTNPVGQKMKMIGLKLPAGVPLTMPIDGQVAKVKLPDNGVTNGFQTIVFNPNDETLRYQLTGDIQFDNMFSLNMKKGESFGRVQNTGIENAGGYNVIFYIIRGTGREAAIAEDEMKKMFPEAFTKPATKAAAPAGTQGATVVINAFYNTPPK